jgi:hypothetical protein
MQVIIVYDNDKEETVDDANKFEELISMSLHHDASEMGIDKIDFEVEVMDATVFDYKCPAWFN